MIVAIITKEKAGEIKGKEYIAGVQYNPIEKGDDFYISLVEAQYLNVGDIVRLEEYIQEIEK